MDGQSAISPFLGGDTHLQDESHSLLDCIQGFLKEMQMCRWVSRIILQKMSVTHHLAEDECHSSYRDSWKRCRCVDECHSSFNRRWVSLIIWQKICVTHLLGSDEWHSSWVSQSHSSWVSQWHSSWVSRIFWRMMNDTYSGWHTGIPGEDKDVWMSDTHNDEWHSSASRRYGVVLLVGPLKL